MKNRILNIGPVSKDYIITPYESYTQIGGAVYYQNCTLNYLNVDVKSIITIGENDQNLLNEFQDKKQIQKIITPKTIEYTNIYDKYNQRKQKATLPINPIKEEDITVSLNKYDKVILSPLCPTDIPYQTIKYLKEEGLETTLQAQGLLRQTDKNGNIIPRKWENIKEYLENTDILCLDTTEAKLAFGTTNTNNENMRKIVNKYKLKTLIVTQAKQGSTIHTKEKSTHILATKATNAKDATGLGDTYIASYLAKKLENKPDIIAGLDASIITKNKLQIKGALKKEESESV